MNEKLNAGDASSASVIRGGGIVESVEIVGVYDVWCFRPDGRVRWHDIIRNTVTRVGKAWLLDNIAAAYTPLVGPFIGMISSVSWSATASTDTMASHGGWTEAGASNAPYWDTPAAGARLTTTWAAATTASDTNTKATSAAAAFTISTTGTVKGCFVVVGSGASATNGNTGGVLLSAGAFSGGDKAVNDNDIVNVSYSIALT